MDYKPMKDKIAVVTGGAGGIGKAISIKLAITGAKIIIIGRDEEKGRKAIEEIVFKGGEATFCQTDLSIYSSVEQSVKWILDNHHRVDILVNNAAVSGYMGPVVETPIEEVEKVMKVNMISVFYLSKLLLPRMIENRFGRIINISSIAYRKNTAHSASYNMTKAALNTFTSTLSKEVASHGITVNAVAPGLVLTDRILHSRIPGMAKELGVSPEEMMEKLTAGTDTGHLTKEEDVAELVMFLASSASQNITGEIINVSGGL
jgi:NAD(P)-dependent dehydrogenase (short-subunit alcohol dehydrogenase family)